MASVGVDAETVEGRVPVFVAFSVFRRVYSVNRSIGPVKLLVEMSMKFCLVVLVRDVESFGLLKKWPFLNHQRETLRERSRTLETWMTVHRLYALCQILGIKRTGEELVEIFLFHEH